MSTQASNSTIHPSEEQFFQALMADIMRGSMIPKVQIERAIGPIIGFFLGGALSTKWNKEIIVLCPEFPIRKARLDQSGNNQSTNIDWLMYDTELQELILLELKTTDTSFRQEQADVYKSLQETIAQKQSAAFLIDELNAIAAASQEVGKYRNILQIIRKKFEPSESVVEKLNSCKRARVVYLAPQISKPLDWPSADSGWTWLSFGELPEKLEEHTYAEHWPAVRNSLISLDVLTRRIRNGDDLISEEGKNYKYLCCFDQVLDHCRSDGSSFVIGLMDWRNKLPSMTIDQLRTKRYKCDSASGGVGKKIARNWINGDEFLSHINTLKS